MRLTKKSPELYISEDEISIIGVAEIDMLKSVVAETPNGRVRINVHPSSDDTLHEMFIAIQRGSYIRAHKHPIKSEAFHMISGSARVVIFNDDGSIRNVVHLNADRQAKNFYYRMSKPYFHTLIIDSDMIVMHEITNGPFVPGGTIYAAFSPAESEKDAVNKFQFDLYEQLAALESQ